jgi:hypothetical protein
VAVGESVGLGTAVGAGVSVGRGDGVTVGSGVSVGRGVGDAGATVIGDGLAKAVGAAGGAPGNGAQAATSRARMI